MFPPMTSSLSLDAYLLRFAKPNTLKFWRRKRSTPEICELRKYRRNIKRFLTTLVSEVLRERLRQAAEHDGKTITGFLEDHQWAVLRATGNNQLIIDLIYPRVSDSLDISKWGPLLTCLILKAVKCLTADEIANVNIIDKLCRKYITRNRRITRKRLPKVKEDWNTICTCSQKMADNAKSAKLIKAVRNFIIDVSLQPASTTKRPYSAPALTNSKADNANLPMVRRPATTTLSRDKVSLNSSRDRPVTFDFTKQRQSNYRAPTLLMIPEAFGGNPEPYKNYDSLSHDHNKSMKKISVEDCEIEAADDSAKSVTRHFWKKTQSSDRSSLLAEENRLRRFSGRSRTPVPIPRTIADIKPAKRPYRLMPLKFHVGNVASGRTFVPSVQATQVEKRTLQHHQHFKKEQNERHRLYSPGYKTPTPRPEASPRDDTSNNSSTPRKGNISEIHSRVVAGVVLFQGRSWGSFFPTYSAIHSRDVAGGSFFQPTLQFIPGT